jgi:hypothetical protein
MTTIVMVFVPCRPGPAGRLGIVTSCSRRVQVLKWT